MNYNYDIGLRDYTGIATVALEVRQRSLDYRRFPDAANFFGDTGGAFICNGAGAMFPQVQPVHKGSPFQASWSDLPVKAAEVSSIRRKKFFGY